VDGFATYLEYVALRAHFNGTYDYHKYRGRVSATRESYDARRDKLFFEKLAKHSDPRGVLISTFVEEPGATIRDVAYSAAALKRRDAWALRVQSLSYLTAREFLALEDSQMSFSTRDGHPPVLRAHLAGKLSLEALIVLLEYSKTRKYWDENMADDPVWTTLRDQIDKYRPFLSFDMSKVHEEMCR